jgi:hypothetical protein
METTDYKTIKALIDPAVAAGLSAVDEAHSSEVAALRADLDRVRGLLNDYRIKVSNVEGAIRDIIDMDGYLSEEMQEVARMLDISLDRRVEGTITVELSYSLVLPYDIDPDDIEFSVDVNCETDGAEDFEWNEEMIDHTAEVL